jgi:hypothetical protein
MILAVTGEEGGRSAVDLGHRDRVGWRAVRRVDFVLGGAVQECVKSGTTDHGDVSESGHSTDPNRGCRVRLWCES